MKNNKKTIPSFILEKTPDAIELIKDIENLTVEDVVVIYAYAEAIVETVREPLIILDGDLRIKTANKAFFDAFKVSKDETYDKLIFELGNGQWDIPELKKALKEVLPKNSHFENFEVTHSFDSIGSRTMMLNARRIVLEGHKTELVLLAIEDATEKMLIDKNKDNFIATASHELKTPLTSMKAFVQILLKQNKNSKDAKNVFMLDKVVRQIDRMEHIMMSFINAYSLQTGKLKLHKERFSMDEMLSEIVETFQYSTDTHKLTFVHKIPYRVFADKERISQAFINLLTNAIKYSPDADSIIVNMKKGPKGVEVSVQDFGIGIPKEQQKIIFDRFYRVPDIGNERANGLGLGLYIAHEIIQEHHGEMWVESSGGNGSTFHFALPIVKSKIASS